MSKPFFSIMIPVYGNIEYLGSCLKSIISQSFADYEIIICYQGDTMYDQSVKDDRIRVIYQKKPSLYRARINAYNEACGDYVIFVDADDELLDGCLDVLYKTIQNNPETDIIQFGYTTSKNKIAENKLKPKKTTLTKEEYLSYFLSEFGTYPIWRKCFKHNTIDFYDEDIFMGEDALLTLAFIKEANKIVSIDNVLYYYRTNAKSGTANSKPEYVNDLAIFINRSFEFRKNENEIEMAIYSFVYTFLVYYCSFPTFDFMNYAETKTAVTKIISFGFTTKPRFIKKYFLKIVDKNGNKKPLRGFILLFKIMRKLKCIFRVKVN